MPDVYLPIKDAISVIAKFLEHAYSEVEKAVLNYSSDDFKGTKTFENCQRMRVSPCPDDCETLIIKPQQNPHCYSIQKSKLRIKTNGEWKEKYKILIQSINKEERPPSFRPDRLRSVFH